MADEITDDGFQVGGEAELIEPVPNLGPIGSVFKIVAIGGKFLTLDAPQYGGNYDIYTFRCRPVGRTSQTPAVQSQKLLSSSIQAAYAGMSLKQWQEHRHPDWA